MRFEAKSEEELTNLLPEGQYRFHVLEATDEISKSSGAEMIKLKLEIESNEGKRIVFDYLLEAMQYKLLHFCQAVNLTDKYQLGTLTASDCYGRAGFCNIVKDSREGYAPQNKVKDYCKPKKVGIGAPQDNVPAEEDFNDSIPF